MHARIHLQLHEEGRVTSVEDVTTTTTTTTTTIVSFTRYIVIVLRHVYI
jgi:hypothetical protein